MNQTSGVRSSLSLLPIKSSFYCLFFLSSFLSAGFTEVLAADSTKTGAPLSNVIASDASVVLQDAGSFLISPTRWTSNDWLNLGAAAGGTALLFTIDEPVRKSLGRSGQNTHVSGIWEIPTRYGDLLHAGTLTLATYVFGTVIDDPEIRLTGRLLGESIALAGIPVLVTKVVTGRSRPYLEEGSSKFGSLQFSGDRQSLPSGHSAVAFAVSIALANRTENVWVKLGLYGMATWTALARIHSDAHWLSDVVAGSCVGIAAGMFVMHRERDRSSLRSSPEARLFLVPTSRGISLVYQF